MNTRLPPLPDLTIDEEFRPIVSELTRRGLLAGGLGIAAALTLAACSTDTSTPSPSQVTRRIPTSTGTVEVPAHPKWIIAATAVAATTLMNLDITPVGSFNGAPNVVLPKDKTRMEKAQSISAADGYSDDLEKIAALHPDLIITFATSPTLAKEKQIAPTIGQDSVHQGWQELCTGHRRGEQVRGAHR